MTTAIMALMSTIADAEETMTTAAETRATKQLHGNKIPIVHAFQKPERNIHKEESN